MSQQFGIPGSVRNRVVVPQSNQPLPEGTHVEIVLKPSKIPAALLHEMEAWDKASDESWNWISALESDQQ